MKEFLLTLLCVISIVSAGVLDNSAEELSIVGDSKVNGRSGIQRISEMSHEDLMHQKFLLDVLQHVNEPIVDEELLQISNAVENELISDRNLYKEGIDADMAHVIELSRSQKLLGKQESFTIANAEHTRQMIGLYRVLVGARDWETLKKNIIHGRAHINGALFVNSLYLAIREREDTQHLIIPGIHEILPELYLDDELVQGAKQINFKQLEATQTTSKTVGPERPTILEMIARNKLLASKNKENVDSLDRSELWMPWREMRMEIAARKAGKGASADIAMSDGRIVLTTTKSESLKGDESGLELLTEDVGFQAFLQSFLSDLCLQEKDSQGKSESAWKQGQNRAGLDRVGLNDDTETSRKSGMRYYEPRNGGGNTRVVNLEEHNDDSGRRAWTPLERGDDMNRADGAQIGRVSLNRNSGTMLQGGIRNRYEQTELPHYWDQSNQQQNGAGLGRIGLNRNMGSIIDSGVRNRFEQTGEDESIWNAHADPYNRPQYWTPMNGWNGNGNWNSPSSNAFERRINGPYSHGWDDDNTNGQWIEPHTGMSGYGMNQRNVYNPESMWNSPRGLGIKQQLLGGGLPTHTAPITNGMPMDWNRQMAMHRQKSKIVDERQGQQGSTVGHNLRELDIDDERLLPFSHRKTHKLSSPGREEAEEQQKENQNDYESETQEPNQSWRSKNLMENANGRNQNGPINNERAWTMTAARGMGNIGVHEGQEINGQHGFVSGNAIGSWSANKRGRPNTRWNEETHNMDSGHWADAAGNVAHRLANNNDEDVDVVGVGMGMGKKRYPRALGMTSNERQHRLEQVRGGELLLHNLQQLVARINLEQIAQGPDQAQDDTEHGKTTAEDSSMKLLREEIEEIEKHLETIIRAEVERKIGMTQKQSARSQAQIDEVIGDALMGKDGETESEVDVLNILRALIQKTALERGGAQITSTVSLDLKDPVIMHVLRRIVHIADAQRQQQLAAEKIEELQAPGITINEVQVDKLSTFIETKDVDLINALDVEQQRAHTRMVVARQQRLNHKDFNIKIDVNAERKQRVVVRTLLGPKLEGSSETKIAQINAQRHNYIVLDAYVAELRAGRNQIKRKSRDITWTAADTTPYSEIQKRVLRALQGATQVDDIMADELHGQTCRFPHRLLLPRGRETGLAMQMLVVITPIVDEDRTMQQWALDQRVCGIGVASANLDRLPLGFPLQGGAIKSATELSVLPNVHLMDVQIYHDKEVKVHDSAHDLNTELV